MTHRSRVLATVLLLAIAGCAGPPTTDEVTAVDAARYAVVAEQWNARLERLERIHRVGIVEFRWEASEDEPARSDQTDLSLWIELPRRVALRAHKAAIGVEFMWIGCDEEQWWVFDLSDQDGETVLYQGSHADRADGQLFIDPLGILALMGLAPLPPFADVEVTPLADGRWSVATASPTVLPGRLVTVLDPDRPFAMKVTLSLDGDDLTYEARHEDHARLSLPGLAPLAQPYFPGRVRIADTNGAVEILLSFDDPSRGLFAQPWDRLFDFERLKRRYRPDRIEPLKMDGDG